MSHHRRYKSMGAIPEANIIRTTIVCKIIFNYCPLIDAHISGQGVIINNN